MLFKRHDLNTSTSFSKLIGKTLLFLFIFLFIFFGNIFDYDHNPLVKATDLNSLWFEESLALIKSFFILILSLLSVLTVFTLLFYYKLLFNLKRFLVFVLLSILVSSAVIGAAIFAQMRVWKELDSYLPGFKNKTYQRVKINTAGDIGPSYSYYDNIYFSLDNNPLPQINTIYSVKDKVDITTLKGSINDVTSAKLGDFNFDKDLPEGNTIGFSIDCYYIRHMGTHMCHLIIERQSGKLMGILSY